MALSPEKQNQSKSLDLLKILGISLQISKYFMFWLDFLYEKSILSEVMTLDHTMKDIKSENLYKIEKILIEELN